MISIIILLCTIVRFWIKVSLANSIPTFVMVSGHILDGYVQTGDPVFQIIRRMVAAGEDNFNIAEFLKTSARYPVQKTVDEYQRIERQYFILDFFRSSLTMVGVAGNR